MPDRHGGQLADRAEVWRKVPGWPVEVSSIGGRIRSLTRRGRDGRTVGGQLLAHVPDRDGYPRVKVSGRWLPVHIAVCLAFHGKPEVRHLDGDLDNNLPSNLTWGTRLENERDKRRNREGTGEEGERREGGKGDCYRPFPVVTPVTGDVQRCSPM